MLCPMLVSSNICTGVAVLKLAETGSTWFFSLLDANHNYKFEKEIYTRDDIHIAVSKKEKVLKSVLSCNHFNSHRPVQGFTINAKNSPGLNWTAVIDETNGYVITWRRSNLIKTCVSIYRKAVQHVCGGQNNVHKDSLSCINEKFTLHLDRFIETIVSQAGYYARLEEASDAACRGTKGRNMTVFYEDMQADQQREMEKVANFFGNRNYSKQQGNADTVKKTSDNLKDLVLNYDEVIAALKQLKVPLKLNCPLVTMFTDAGYRHFDECHYEGLHHYLMTAVPHSDLKQRARTSNSTQA